MKAENSIESKQYKIPSRGILRADFIGMDAIKSFCKFLVFDQYNTRKVIMVPLHEEVEETK